LARRHILSNLKWLTVSTFITTLSIVVSNAMLARKMGTSTFGEWALVTATASWIAVIRGGVGSHLTRLSSSSPELAQTLLTPSWVLMAAWSVALGGFALAVNISLQSQGIFASSILAISGTTLTAMSYVVVSAFAGRDQMQWSLVDSTQVFALAVVVSLVPAKYLNTLTVAAIFLGTSAMVAVPCLAMGIAKLKPTIPKKLIHATWRLACENVWLVGIQLLVAFHLSIDICLLRMFRDPAQVGLFAAALKVITAARLLPWLVMTSLIPELSRSSMEDGRLVSRVWTTVGNTLLPMVGGGVLILFFMPGSILGLLYSHSFSGSSTALIILGVSLIPHCLWQVLGVSVMAAGRYRAHFASSLLCLVAHGVSSAILIPLYGAAGASLAFVVAESVSLFTIAIAASRGVGLFSFLEFWRFLACIGISCAIGIVPIMRGWPPLAVTGIVLVSYMALLVKFGTVSKMSLQAALQAGTGRRLG
jgi:O-antigen/teichoic acid export membrane protein